MCESERWTDTLLYVKNVGENVTEDSLKEVFTDAEDIVIAKSDSSHRKDDKKTRSVSHNFDIITENVKVCQLSQHTHLLSQSHRDCGDMERHGYRVGTGDWATHHCHHQRLQGNHIFVTTPVDISSMGMRSLFKTA